MEGGVAVVLAGGLVVAGATDDDEGFELYVLPKDVAVFKTVLVMSKVLPKCRKCQCHREHVIVHLETCHFAPRSNQRRRGFFGPSQALEIKSHRGHSTYSFHLQYATMTLFSSSLAWGRT